LLLFHPLSTFNTQLSTETYSLPALARCYPHSFTFYVANPIRSILNFVISQSLNSRELH
jgi:hypothetical protein